MKGKVILEVIEGQGISVDVDLEGAGAAEKLLLLHSLTRGLNMSQRDVDLFCLGMQIGVFQDAATEVRIDKEELKRQMEDMRNEG